MSDMSEITKLVVVALISNLSGFLLALVAIRRSRHENKKTDAETVESDAKASKIYSDLAKENALEIKDLRKDINLLQANYDFLSGEYKNLRTEMNHAMQKAVSEAEQKIRELQVWIKALVAQLKSVGQAPVSFDEAIANENASIERTPTVRLKSIPIE